MKQLKDMSAVVFSPDDSIHIANRYGYLRSLVGSACLIKKPAFKGGLIARFKQFIGFLSLLRKTNADIYHAHYAISDATILAFCLGKFPLLVSTMGGDILLNEQGDPTKLMRRIAQILLAEVNSVTAKSNYNASVIRALSRNKAQPHILSWGVDLSVFKENSPDHEIPSNFKFDDFVILQPRGLTPIYNTHLLLNVCHRLKLSGYKFKLVLCNSIQGEYVYQTWQRIDELELKDNIVAFDRLSQDELNNLYNQSDVVVSLASSDGLPMTVIEALATNTEVIVGKLPHLLDAFPEEVVSWVDLTENGVFESLAARMAMDRSSKIQDNKRVEFVRKNYNLDKDIKDFEQLIEQMSVDKQRPSKAIRLWVMMLFLAEKMVTFFAKTIGRKRMSWCFVRKP